MKIITKLKELLNLDTKKIVKKGKSYELKKAKNKNKFLNIFVWLIFILPFIVSCLLVFKHSVSVAKIRHHDQVLKSVEDNLKHVNEVSFTSELNLFSDEFVDLYMNTAKTDEDKKYQLDSLKKYYAKNMSVNELNFNRVDRTLLDKKFYKMTHLKADVYNVTYKVIYQLKSESEQGKELIDVTKIMLLNIPIYIKDNKYVVVDYPYFTPLENNQSDFKGLSNSVDLDEADVNKDEFEVFLNDFFKKYADLKPSDMAYVMKQPSSLNGLRQFVSVDKYNVFKNTDGTLLVKALVIFKENEVNLENTETYTLTVSKKDNKYFIDDMEHIR